MDPLVTTGLLSIGSRIIQGALPPSTSHMDLSKAKSFESSLNKLTGDSGSSKNLDSLRSELIDSPNLKNFLSRNEGNSISLDQLSDGSVRLLSSSGDFITIRPDSPACAKACQFLNQSISAGKNLSPDRENSVILIG